MLPRAMAKRWPPQVGFVVEYAATFRGVYERTLMEWAKWEIASDLTKRLHPT